MLILQKRTGTPLSDVWLMKIYGNDTEIPLNMDVDSSGNPYLAGATTSYGTTQHIHTLKLNAGGTANWQRAWGDTGGSTTTYANSRPFLDSSGNVYSGGTTTVGTGGWWDVVVNKSDNDGNLQWQRRWATTAAEYVSDVAVNSAGDVYLAGSTNAGIIGGTPQAEDGRDMLLIKYNTSGVYQWHFVYGTTRRDIFRGMDIDSSGNLYCIGMTQDASANVATVIMKIDSSGIIIWQRQLGTTGATNSGGIAVDSAGNVYGALNTSEGTGFGGGDIVVFKYNSSGVIQWQRRLGTTGDQTALGVDVDSSGNLYICGTDSSVSPTIGIVAKWDTSGSLQWANNLVNTAQGHDIFGRGIKTNTAFRGIFASFGEDDASTNQDHLVLSTHLDGSQTGNYGPSIDYQTASYSEGAATLTDSAGGMTTSSTISYTESALTFTYAGTSLLTTTYLKT